LLILGTAKLIDECFHPHVVKSLQCSSFQDYIVLHTPRMICMSLYIDHVIFIIIFPILNKISIYPSVDFNKIEECGFQPEQRAFFMSISSFNLWTFQSYYLPMLINYKPINQSTAVTWMPFLLYNYSSLPQVLLTTTKFITVRGSWSSSLTLRPRCQLVGFSMFWWLIVM